MGLFSSITKAISAPFNAVADVLGGGGGGASQTSNATTTSTSVTPTTNVNLDLDLDLKPLVDVLAESQRQSNEAAIISKAIELEKAQTEKENYKNLFGFLEDSKKGLWIVALGGGFIYLISRKESKK